MKYKQWLDTWLANYVKPIAKRKTFENYSYLISKHIKGGIGELELKKISVHEIQKFIVYLLKQGNTLTKKGLSSSTVNSIVTIIQSSLKKAYLIGITKKYNGQEIQRPKMIKKEILSFSLAEQRKIESFIIKEKREEWLGIILCLYTGLRLGELLSLTWEDVDLQKHIIRVSKTSYYGKNDEGLYQRITYSPKTTSSYRILPFPKQLISLMKEKKQKYTSIYVVSHKNTPISLRNYQRIFANLLSSLSIVKKGFHSLRHTFATRALECGMDVKTLSEILGHKNAATTLNLYAHSFMEHKRKMMDLMGSMMIKE